MSIARTYSPFNGFNCDRQDDRLAKAINRFPLCVLHNVRIVDAFPRGCPLEHPNPLVAIQAYQDRAWTRFGNCERGGCDDAARVEICQACEARKHHRVKYLRDLEGLNNA
jgi:hypothetical protein